MQATTAQGTVLAETEPCSDVAEARSVRYTGLGGAAAEHVTTDSTNVSPSDWTQRRRMMEEIIARGRPADDTPEDSHGDDDDGSEPDILEDELWQRSLMMAEIIERGRENEAPANGGGLGGGVAQDDELLDAAVEDMELQRSLFLSELTSIGVPDPEVSDPEWTTRSIEGISGAGAAAADASERPNSGGETDGDVATHRRDPDAEAVADLMAQIVLATQDRRRATESARESMVNNRWVRGARGAFDRVLSDIRSQGASDQHHEVESEASDGNGSHISEARQLIAAAFPDWRIRQQRDASGRAALMADIVAAGRQRRGEDDDTLNGGAWPLEAWGDASLLSDSAPSDRRAARAEISGRVRAALHNYERLLGGILRPGRAAAESAHAAPRLTEQRPAEEFPASSWQRRNTGSHVDLMAEIIARGGRSQRTSDNDMGPQAAAADDQTRNGRDLFLAEITSRGGQAQTLQRRRSERMGRMARAVRQMSEAAHASLSNELDSSSAGVELGVEAPVCVVCMESPRSHAFVPCGHRCVCWGCVRRMRRMSPLHCPICRRDSTDVIKIYL